MQAARGALLSAVHAEVSAYLSDRGLVFEGPQEFPSTHRLTGDYYIGDQRFDIDPETGRCRVSVRARCLAHSLPGEPHPDDYLGLEVWLDFNPELRVFTVSRNTDSSSI
jgi:hypothetical protein